MFDRINSRLSKLFKQFLEKENSSVTNYYNSTSRYYGGCAYTIYFYEWSNINNRPRQFNSIDVFLRYLRDSNIEYTDYQEQRLREGKWFYASCVPGRSFLLLFETYTQLRERLENR